MIDMTIASIEYLGDLRTNATHLSSGNTLITDAPTDNNGKGEAFSPTDLMSTSLGSCMFTLMGIAALNHGIEFKGGKAEVKKIMLTNPRRVGEISIHFILNGNYEMKSKKILEHAAINCPVAKSLNPEILQNVSFEYVND